MSSSVIPTRAAWDLTYACQLRCTHCYSESGRRAARKLPLEDMMRVADALIAMDLRAVQLSGGEPLLVQELPLVVERLTRGGISVALFTNGILLDDDKVREIAPLFARIHVSLDGASARVHDAIRGVPGSYDAALRALASLDRFAAERRAAGLGRLRFGIDCTIVQSNFPELELFCSRIAPRFPELVFINLGAAVPSGLASRESYASLELLTDAELETLRDPAFVERIHALAPSTVEAVSVSDNFVLQMHPAQIERGEALLDLLHVEPDGRLRSMPPYEATVGNLLDEDPSLLWQRVLEQRRHPFIVEALTPVRSMMDWAAATRRIDLYFAAEQDRHRFSNRPLHVLQKCNA